MAKYRPFLCNFWTDPDIEPMTSDEKLVYAFLFTNSLTSESGIYDISQKFISERTNISLIKINNIINTLSNTYHKITYDNKTIFVHGFLRRNGRGRPELLEKSLISDINNFPSIVCWNKFIEIYKFHSISNKIKELLKTSMKSCQDFSLEIELESRNRISLKEEEVQEKGKTWRDAIEIYQADESAGYNAIIVDRPWLDLQEKIKPFPNLNILKTLERAHLNFWSTMAGWKNKKKSKTIESDWLATYANAIGQKMNQVFDDRKKTIEQNERCRLL